MNKDTVRRHSRLTARGKDMRREIKKTITRFISIMLIVGVGVGLFVGVKAAPPSMRHTADLYFNSNNVMDLMLLSTVGFDDGDVDEIAKIDGVGTVMPGYSVDAIMKSVGSGSQTISIFSLPEDIGYGVSNTPTLVAGRLPETENECLVLEKDIRGNEYRIGDIIRLSENAGNTELSTVLSNLEFKIVGLGETSMNFSNTLGTSSIGDGTVYQYMYILSSCFSYERFTEVFINYDCRSKGVEAFTKEYEATTDAITPLLSELGKERFDSFIEESNNEIDEAQEELDKETKKAHEQLNDAKKQLDDAKKQIDDAMGEITSGWEEYNSGTAEYEAKMSDARKQIADSKSQLANAERDLEAGILKYNAGKADYEKKVAEGRKTLDDGWKKYNDGLAEYNKGLAEYEAGEREYRAGVEKFSTGSQEYQDGLAEYETSLAEYNLAKQAFSAANEVLTYLENQYLIGLIAGPILDEARATYNSAYSQLSDAEQQLADAEQQLADAQAQLNSAPQELEAARQKLEAASYKLAESKAELESGYAELMAGENQYTTEKAAAEKELADAEKEIEEGRKTIADGYAAIAEAEAQIPISAAEAEAELNDAKKQLEDAEKEVGNAKKDYASGLREYNQAVKDAEDAISDGNKRIMNALELIDGVETGKWYILTRNDIIDNYASFDSDAERIDAIGNVFPVFFLFIAALVCLTTMSRMIDERRSEIGTYKALGYNAKQISRKYILYAFYASMLGSFLGFISCIFVLPQSIFNSYKLMYHIPKIEVVVPWGILGISIAVALLCTVVIAWIACRKALSINAATLMRPRAPKAGSRILLERIGFVWNNISFNQKTTFRNLFRYKARLIMTIVGIAGCTALIISGFSIQDSVTPLVEKQFTDVSKYELLITLSENYDSKGSANVRRDLTDADLVDKALFTKQLIGKAKSEKVTIPTSSVYLFVPEFCDQISEYIELRDLKTKDPVSLDDSGAVITDKLAEVLKLSVGDEITFISDDMDYSIPISAIVEHYVYHYIYISPALFEKVFDNDISFNSLVATYGNSGDHDRIAEDILSSRSDIISLMRIDDTADTVKTVMDNISSVILLMIFFAALLDFIVVYNLTNINISERVREIATLKVLGLKPSEVSMYVFRENFILCIIGIIVGCIAGYFMGSYMISACEVDVVRFVHYIRPFSFVKAAIMTFVFTLLVNIFMTGKLKKINMVESLKAVE